MASRGAGKLASRRCIMNLLVAKHNKIIALLSRYFINLAH
jgi:hypothetical protein